MKHQEVGGTLTQVNDGNPYRDLPRVDALIESARGALPDILLASLARSAVETARRHIDEGEPADAAELFKESVHSARRAAGTAIVNATGVLLHTNLGRARWSDEALERAREAAAEAGNVELDVDTGTRSRRGAYVSELLQALTGAEDALVVNNNASALLLALAATSSGRAVPVARGELIEIGGSYRLPAVMEASGSRLVEVGTTNRTRPGDFETALQVHDCGAMLKVHPSNYRVEGFTAEVSVRDLAALAQSEGIPLIHDIGSGLLDKTAGWLGPHPPEWLTDEPAARQSVDEGADLVTFSGDKLLGGPQAGIVVGSSEVMARLRSHPLNRALRVDGVTLAALGATLEAHAAGDVRTIPLWRQALAAPEEIAKRAERIADGVGGTVQAGASTIGAGTVPGMQIPTSLVLIEGRDDMFERLLHLDEPILTRRDSGNLVIDPRSFDDDNDDWVINAVRQCLS